MWGLFKKKEKEISVEKREGYKIVPYKDEGFIVEFHRQDDRIFTYKTDVHRIPSIRTEDGSLVKEEDRFISPYAYGILGSYKIFKTKQDAKELIDAIIKGDNERERRNKEKFKREQEFARNNPPEWYP